MPIYLRQSTASQEIPLGPMVDSTDGDTAETALTIANTDIKVWKTGATTLANKNSGGATHISGGIYYAVLDATDTNTLGPLVVFCHPTGALATRTECVVLAANIYDSLVAGTDDLAVDAAAIADAVFDEALSGHTTPGSLGQRLLQASGTAQAGAAGTVTLASGSSATDDEYVGRTVVVIAGTGVGQARTISDYVGSTKVASVSPDWTTAPDSTSVYVTV